MGNRINKKRKVYKMTVEEIVNKYPEIKGYIRIVDAFTKATSGLLKAQSIVVSLSGGRL